MGDLVAYRQADILHTLQSGDVLLQQSTMETRGRSSRSPKAKTRIRAKPLSSATWRYASSPPRSALRSSLEPCKVQRLLSLIAGENCNDLRANVCSRSW